MRVVRAATAWGFAAMLAASCATGETADTGNGDDASPGDDGGPCEAPKSACGTQCVNLSNDTKNCGKCGTACNSNLVCNSGQCSDTCTPPLTRCGGPQDAGAPHDTGAGDAALEGGAKDAGPPLDAGTTTPYCANLSNDPDNCGKCGRHCGKSHVCNNGVCQLDCQNGAVPCIAGDTCIPPGTCCSSTDCKITGQVCPSPGSQCACPSGEKMCSQNNQCISSNDCCTNADCPAQGSTCPAPGGSCVCPSGTNTLGGTCGAATPKGPLALGQTVQAQGILSTNGAEDWVAVTFGGDNNDHAYHPSVAISGGAAGEFVFDVYAQCGGATLTCGDGGNCNGKTQWEVKYDPTVVGKAGEPNWQPIPAVGTAYVRVYRGSGGVTCDQFTLTLGD